MNEFINKIRTTKGVGIIAAVFLLGFMIVFISPGEDENTSADSFDCAQYISHTEEKLSEMISRVSGAGSVSVMVTLESSTEQYYHRNTKSRSSKNGDAVSYEAEEAIVLEKDDPILVKEIFPEIKGIAVVCDGARSSSVTQKIINLVACALNVPSNRIYVTY
ncbi:MAG: hypothetical protein E7588_05580 [Ruminococcaceae bacterium]|nr:hypothetical protein [Oscillospiraceae bacterium]